MLSYQKFKLKRRFRKLKRQFLLLQAWFGNYLERHLLGGWKKLGKSRWGFIFWIFLISFCFFASIFGIGNLDKYYLEESPQAGGIYIEGLSGQVTRINPVLPENSASKDISSIIFSGLTKIDSKGQLIGDLAKNWEVSKDYKTYTFHLKDNVYWHDGKKFTANDVAFTISTIQNADTLSPYAQDWSGVKYEIVDDNIIKIILSNPYPSFINNTTVGILPKHKLESIKQSQIKFSDFNQSPIGTGPFELESIDSENSTIMLKANDRYFAQKPFLKKVKFISYKSYSDLIDAYIKREIMGISKIETDDLEKAKKLDSLKIHQIDLPNYIGLFINNNAKFINSKDVRKSLAYATDRKQIISQALANAATPIYYPILPGYVGYNPVANPYNFDLDKAKSIITSFPDYVQLKNHELLLVTLDDKQSIQVADIVKEQWSKLGLNIKVKSVDLDTLQKNHLKPRNYDILLYGQNLGFDSDVYSFWHSSQTKDPGLNLSNYSDSEIDSLLENGRISRDNQVKSNKYASFVDRWSNDVPAILLYSPYYLYGTEKRVSGINVSRIVEPSDRFYNIQDWAVKKHLQLRIKQR